MKPDWKDAPAWATHLAQFEDGRWFWANHEPYPCYKTGYMPSRKLSATWQYCDPPRKCEKRP